MNAAITGLSVLVVADVRLYRDGMQAALVDQPQFAHVEAAASINDALQLLAMRQPDVVIVDMATRESLAGIRRLREFDPGVIVVGFGVDETEGEVLACAEAGLAGYVPTDATLHDLVERVGSVVRGELLCSPRMAAALFRHLERREEIRPSSVVGSLTPRERDVLRLIDAGLSNKEIAARLHIEVSTVKNHVHNLLDKLRVSSRMQAAAQLGSHLSLRRGGSDWPLALQPAWVSSQDPTEKA